MAPLMSSPPLEPLILYATETGNAQDVADNIARNLRRVSANSRVEDMATYSPPSLISEDLIVFVVSTTGAGKEPRSMTNLWTMLLRSDLPLDLFEDTDFAVFGLGDTAYEKFCWPAKKLSRRMTSLGAREVCRRGEGDDQSPLGLDEALVPWIQDLLCSISSDVLPPVVPFPRITLSNSISGTSKFAANDSQLPQLLPATVQTNKRITSPDWYQDVRHLEFTFDQDIDYAPGDVALIHPLANPADVDEFITSMGWDKDANTVFSINRNTTDQSFPGNMLTTCTIRDLFTQYLDFNAVPRRTFFQYLRYFATEELETERLDEFLSAEGADELYDYCYKVRRTIKEVLTEFRNIKIPRDYIFDVFPPMRPREFSIASSVQVHPRQIQLCVAIVKYRTKLKVPRKGVCTAYLSSLKSGDTLNIRLKKGLLSLPANPQTPVICIGPGTGIAPMRAVIEHRLATGAGTNVLYFGCRSAEKDQHYKSEWVAYASNGGLSYRVACSRDSPEGVAKTYVQDLISEDSEKIWELIGMEGAWVLISGSANKMPLAVKDALKGAAQTCGGMTSDEAQRYIHKMESERRLIEECWS